MVVAAVVVLRADLDELLKLPSVRHGRDEVGELVLVALQHSVDVLPAVAATARVTLLDALLHQEDQVADVVELGFLEDT